MARRSDNTREELKEMVVEAGLSLLTEGGVNALTARAIANRIGYTVGTLYNVFADLEEIILHLNLATLKEMQATIAPLAQSKKAPLPRLLTIAHAYGDYALAHPARWNLLHNHPRTQKLPDWFRDEVDIIFQMVESILLEMKGMTKKSAHDAARVLWAGLHGICALSLSQKLEYVEAKPMHALIDNFVDSYIRGLSA